MPERRRCFFDMTIDGELAGRIVFELYDDITPVTCENFLQLCAGQAGLGKTTAKPLSFKGTVIHRVIKNFMIQGGDFSRGDGTGGESIYGGVFDDENFYVKHDQPFILSMANRGPNTNGSQFFITTNATSHLNDVHVAFGRVISGQDVVIQIENLKVGQKSRPIQDVVIAACGQLVKKKTTEEAEDEKEVVTKHKKKKKRSESTEIDEKGLEKKDDGKDYFSTIKPEDLPEVPDTHNFLMRRGSPKNVESGQKGDSRRRRSRSPRNRPKVKGRGRLLYRSPSKEGSSTPPHWKREADRLIGMEKLKDIQDKQRKLVEEREARMAAKGEEQARQETFGYRNQPLFNQQPSEVRDRRDRDDHARGRDHYKLSEANKARSDYEPNRHREEGRRGEDRRRDEGRRGEERRRDEGRRGEDRHRDEGRRGEDRHRDDVKHRDEDHGQKQQDEEDQMHKYEKRRRERRPSDIERERYRKGELSGLDSLVPTYQPEEQQSSHVYPPASNTSYSVGYGNTAYYPPVPVQSHASGYQNGNVLKPYDPVELAKAAAAYAAQYSANVPKGHYASIPEPKKPEAPDPCVIEAAAESHIQPPEDNWDKDHGKRAEKRVHQVVENDRVTHPKSDKKSSRRSPDRDKRRDSPPSKHRRDDRKDRRSPDRRDDRRRSRSNDKSHDRRRQRSSSPRDRSRRRH